jgi:hypothetical protein
MPKPYNTLVNELTGDNLFRPSTFGKSNSGVLCCDGTHSRLTRQPYKQQLGNIWAQRQKEELHAAEIETQSNITCREN